MKFYIIYDEYIKYLSINLKPTTILFIDRGFKKHILPYFGNKNINNISNEDIINWQNYIKKLGFSNSFNDNIQTMLKKIFDYTEKFYGIKNIFIKFDFIKSFKPEENKKINIWTLNEYKRFIKKVNDPVYKALFNTLFFTGIRKGELLALTFLDLKNRSIFINKSITKELFNNEHLILTPKTSSSIRNIKIDYFLNKELNKLKYYYLKKYNYFNESFYIFGGIKPISSTDLKRKKDYYCNLAKVKQIRIHDFRHSHASMLYKNNIKIKEIQERLGHSDISTTLNTYVHHKYENRVIRKLFFLKFLNLYLKP